MAQMAVTIPDDIPTAVTAEEAARLATLATGGDVLELGAWLGFSTVLLAQAARRVTSVDWHQGDVHAGEADTWEPYRANLARYGVTGKVDARRGRFADVLPVLAKQGVLFDGCFIDAQHDSESVAADLALALPLIRPGGWVAFHDYGRDETTGHPGFGVTGVADRFGVAGVTGSLAWGYVPGPAGGTADRDRTLTIVGLPFQSDGSGYHRFYLPFKSLVANSRHVYGVPPRGAKIAAPTAADVEDVDVLAMQRPAFALGTRQFDRLAGAVARVYETDDDMLTMETSNLSFLTDPRAAESVRYCLRRAEMVTVSTPYLAELYAPFNSNIRILPNFVKASLLDMPRKRRDRVTLGWQGGSSHLVDLCAVQDPLREVLDAHPEVDMHWIGVDYSPLVRRECRFTPWAEDVGDYYKAVDFDVTIAPLTDVPFNRAKSYLKALDAGARGIPIIATDMEPYRDFVIDGVTGYLVRTEAEWKDRLTELLCDADARAEMGAKAYEHAKAYTMEENWRLWEQAYESLA